MTFKDFLESLKKPALYDSSLNIIEFQSVDEPHYLLETSGSSLKKRYIHMSSHMKKASEALAEAHPMNDNDRWWLSLSPRHVAGFSIWARSHFLNLKAPLEKSFSTHDFLSTLTQEEITILSLVPTQIYDIVQSQFKAPSHLKYVFVGGAKLSDDLFKKAQDLGWPLVVCYGSTETFAQMSSSEDNTVYTPYPGWSFQKKEGNSYTLDGPGLFSFSGSDRGYIKRAEPFLLEDLIEFDIKKNQFKLLGRKDGQFKHKGSYQSFVSFKEKIEAFLLEKDRPLNHFIPVVIDDERAGGRFSIVVEHAEHDVVEELFKSEPAIDGAFYMKDLSPFFSELKKPLKSKLSDALKRPLLYV